MERATLASFILLIFVLPTLYYVLSMLFVDMKLGENLERAVRQPMVTVDFYSNSSAPVSNSNATAVGSGYQRYMSAVERLHDAFTALLAILSSKPAIAALLATSVLYWAYESLIHRNR